MKKKRSSNTGIINGFLNFLSDKILVLLKSGFLGKLFSSSDALEAKAARGIIVGPIDYAASGEVSPYKRKNIKFMDESIFVNLLRRSGKYLESCELNWYGLYFFIFALYSLLIHIIKMFILSSGDISWSFISIEYVMVSLFIIISSTILLRCNEPLKMMIMKSRLLRPMLEGFAGVSENDFSDVQSVNGETGYFLAITLGILSGGMTYFTSPLNILLVLFMLFAVITVIKIPELGVLLTIFVSPFLELFEHPTVILVSLVLVDFIAYMLKVLVGKRLFRFRLTDALVCLFGLLFAMGGVVTSGGISSFRSAMTYAVLMLCYFMVVNLFDSRDWLGRCVIAIAVPSVLISLYGLFGYALSGMPSKWIDTSMFHGISNRAVSIFENPNVLATYLILTAPFIWICVFNKKISAKLRFCASVGAISSAVCIVLTWSRGAWMGIIAALLVFSLINYKYSLKYILIAVLTSPIWGRIIPKNVTSRFMSIGNLADSSTYYRLYTWKGSLKMIADYWITGIGVGESAFTQIYPLYSYIGIETTVHSHNLFLQIAIELGVVALIVYLFTIFLVFQKGFWCLNNSSDKWVKLFASASISGLTAALVHGMVDHIWYNYRVFFMFWIVTALVCVSVEVCRKENLKNDEHIFTMRERAVSLDIIF